MTEQFMGGRMPAPAGLIQMETRADTPQGEVVIRLMNVTPQWATAMLDANVKNRRRDKHRVNALKAAMARGDWRLTHQGLAINSLTGEILDGQHRLAAVEESGVTILTFVTSGDFDFDLIDVGKPRTAADLLSVAGKTNGMTLAAMAKLVYAYDRREPRPWGWMRRQMAPGDIHKIVDHMAEHANDNILDGRQIARRIGGGGAGLSAGLYVAERWSRSAILLPRFEQFRDGLQTGAGMGEDDPRLALASWFAHSLNRTVSSTDSRPELAMMLTLRAYTAFLRSETMRRLMVQEPSTYVHRLERLDSETFIPDVLGLVNPADSTVLRTEPVAPVTPAADLVL